MTNQRLPISLFHGHARKMELVSKKPPKPNEDGCEERLTIAEDGSFSLSFYDWDETTGLMVLSFEEKDKGSEDWAVWTLEALSQWFSFAHEPETGAVQDEGLWKLVLTSREGESFLYSGPLSQKAEYGYRRLSNLLRHYFDKDYLLAFSGVREEEGLRRITVDYQRGIGIQPNPLPNIPWGTDRLNYSEQLILDRESGRVEHSHRFGSSCHIHREYRIEEGISQLFEDWDEEGLFSNIEEKEEDASLNPKEDASYRITLEFGQYKPLVLQGSFDKNGLPKDWAEWANSLKNFLNFYGKGEILEPSLYSRVRRRIRESIFCSVIFDDGGKPYHYLTDDETLKIDDFVLVPVKGEKRIVMARIVNIEYFTEETAPYPMDKMRHILRKFSADDFLDDMPAYSVSEPLEGTTPEEVREALEANPTEATLAALYAKTSNQITWLFHRMIDEYVLWFTPRYREWATLEQELSERILEILKRESGEEAGDAKRTTVRTHHTIFTLMERNGYKNFLSWWIP